MMLPVNQNPTPMPMMRPGAQTLPRPSGWVRQSPVPVPLPVASSHPTGLPSRVNELGAGFLYLFIFLLLGRFCDIYLSGLHLPLVTSIIAMVFAVGSGQMAFAMTSGSAKAMLGFTVWMAIGTPIGIWPSGSGEVLTEWLKSLTSFIIIMAMVDTLEKAERMMQVMAVSYFCAAALTLTAGDSVAGRLKLYTGLYSGPNELSTACVTGLIVWWFVLSAKNLSLLLRVGLVPCALFIASVQPKTGSRSGLITLGVVLLMLLTRFSMTKRLMVLATVAAGGFALLVTLPADIRLRYLSMFTETTAQSAQERKQLEFAQGSSDERWRLVVDSIAMTAQHPVFGVGAGNFGLARYGEMLEAGKKGTTLGTHNSYTQVSSELGIPALIFFIASLVYCWRNIRRVVRLYKPLQDERSKRVFHAAHSMWLLLIAYLVIFCFEYVAYQPFYLVVCALITSFSHMALNDYKRWQQGQQQARLQPA